MDCIKNQDVAGLNNLMAEVAPVEDGADHEASSEYPLPVDHWLNTPLGKEGDYKTLLHLAIESGENLKSNFC